jgi:hypothetical protein
MLLAVAFLAGVLGLGNAAQAQPNAPISSEKAVLAAAEGSKTTKVTSRFSVR